MKELESILTLEWMVENLERVTNWWGKVPTSEVVISELGYALVFHYPSFYSFILPEHTPIPDTIAFDVPSDILKKRMEDFVRLMEL